MSERVLVIGFEAEHESFDRAAFDTDVALTAYDAVVIDPASVPALWRHVSTETRATMDKAEVAELATKLIEILARRRREATELLAAGGTIICFLRPLGRPLHVVRPGPRGNVTVILHAYSWLPEEPSLARLVITGQQVSDVHCADEAHPASALLRAQGDALRAEAFVANEQMSPDWQVVATDAMGRVVAFEVPMGEGRLLFVPPVAGRDARERGERLARFFAPPPEPPKVTPKPDWMGDIALPGQPDLEKRLAILEGQIEDLEAQFLDARSRHGLLARLNKLLYVSSGAELAAPAAEAFRLFGFTVDTAGAECLLLGCPEGEGIAVVAAAEGAIDSDPYWALMREIEARPEGQARGIIVGNPFCHEPPSARGEPFSDLLRRGAQHREVCLLSTLEAHAAVAAVLERDDDEALCRAIRGAILEATGPCLLMPLLGNGESDSED